MSKSSLKTVLSEFEKWSVFKERNFIKPFASLEEVWFLINDKNFLSKVHANKKFYTFIRKKLFWILDTNTEEYYLIFKGFDSLETDTQLIDIVDQILLNYFADNLSFTNLCKISIRNDSYNSLTAYSINSKRGYDQKSPLN